MGMGFSRFLLMSLLILTVSCGAKVNNKKGTLAEDEINFLLIEKQCATGVIIPENVTTEITQLYSEFQIKYPLSFLFIPVRLYDYKKPLVINLNDLAISLSKVKSQMSDKIYFEANVTNIAIELYYLYLSTMRFEGNKCAFPSLVTKKTQDLTPYLVMRDFCTSKENNYICSSRTIDNLTTTEAQFVEDNTVKICQAFNATSVSCQAQYNIQKQNNTVNTLIGMYQKRFEQEKFNKLFTLRDSHLRFNCLKDDDKIVMNIKVSSVDWDYDLLEQKVQFVSETWSRENFKLNIELVSESGSDVVQIIPSNSPVSRVPDDNNRLIYLSQQLDAGTSQKVLAHEFGHVLGFPDCYTEFFDNQKKDLIYYEISAENTNIMCSLKSGVSVPDDYLNQLTQNSCLFN